MSKFLKATVFKFGKVFLEGNFEAPDEHYQTVVDLLDEIDLTPEGAEDLLLGFMHAQDVNQVSEEMGQMALVATVYLLEQGMTELIINADDKQSTEGQLPS